MEKRKIGDVDVINLDDEEQNKVDNDNVNENADDAESSESIDDENDEEVEEEVDDESENEDNADEEETDEEVDDETEDEEIEEDAEIEENAEIDEESEEEADEVDKEIEDEVEENEELEDEEQEDEEQEDEEQEVEEPDEVKPRYRKAVNKKAIIKNEVVGKSRKKVKTIPKKKEKVSEKVKASVPSKRKTKSVTKSKVLVKPMVKSTSKATAKAKAKIKVKSATKATSKTNSKAAVKATSKINSKAITKATSKPTIKINNKPSYVGKSRRLVVSSENIADKKKKQYGMTVGEELQKISNIKSTEQIKKPKRVMFMFCFYVVVILAIVAFCIIKFTNPTKVVTILKETTTIVETESTSANKSDIVKVDYDKLYDMTTITTPIIDEEESIEEQDTTKKQEETTKKIEEKTKNKETIKAKEETSKRKEETTKKKEETTKKETVAKVVSKNETDDKVIDDKIIVESEASKVVTSTNKTETKKSGIDGLLPKYKEVLYSYAMFNQFSTDELGTIYKKLESEYIAVQDNIFGDIDFNTKGKNGIIYLNYTAVQSNLIDCSPTRRAEYEKLAKASYLDYIKDSHFQYDSETYSNKLKVMLEFKNAKDQGLYYEIPARFYEPTDAKVSNGGSKFVKLRVLKKAKVGFTQSFLLQAELEILDKECNTKINPYFDIEDTVGPNPKAASLIDSKQFNIVESLSNSKFNYIIFDKKGYVTGLFKLQS